MNDKKDNALVPRPSGAVEKVVPGAKRILSDMVSDTLALAEQRAPGTAKFRIGDYDWCEPDYQQILVWAEETGLEPEEVINRLLDQQSLREIPEPDSELSTYVFKQPLFASGRLLKVNLNLRLLRCSKLRWVNGLEITHVCMSTGEISDLQLSDASGRILLSDLGSLPLPRLSWLRCQSLGLNRLDLTRVPRLEGLDCTGNRLHELHLDHVPKLVRLHCRKNELTELKFDQTPNLRTLNCCANKLTQLTLPSLNRLSSVFCGENRLNQLKLGNLPSLVTLVCRKNRLHELDLTEVPDLQWLDCLNNQISKLDLSRCSKLRRFACNRNQLTRLDLSSLQGLKWLECANNAISELDLSSCPNLEEVDCSGNPISVIDIRGLKNLRVLNRSPHTKVLMDPEQEHTVQDLEAQFQKGMSYYFGYRLPQNYTEAAKLFLLAAGRGHIDSQTYLAECYFEGNGAPQDYGKAVEWYQRAAAQGNPGAQANLSKAQANLGLAYLYGKGVSKNKIEAYKWIKLACEQGDKEVTEKLTPLVSKLSSGELKEADISEKAGIFFPLNLRVAIKVGETVMVGTKLPTGASDRDEKN